eukprot:gene13735-19635_t
MGVALTHVELTKVADDPFVHFGDVLQLAHAETGCVLALDLGVRNTRGGEDACAASASAECRAPCARNTLIPLKYVPPKSTVLVADHGDDGIRIRLAFHPAASGEPEDAHGGPRPLCLFSKPVSTTDAAMFSRSQLVGGTYRSTSDTLWMVVTPDPEMRRASDGVEVLAGEPILIMHCNTQKALLIEPTPRTAS